MTREQVGQVMGKYGIKADLFEEELRRKMMEIQERQFERTREGARGQLVQ
jgi:hypothetical protein